MKLEKLLISASATMREAMSKIDSNGQGIVLVVDSERRLKGTVTDGDIRRAILHDLDLDLDKPVGGLLNVGEQTRTPITAPQGTSESELLSMMNANTLRHVPILDENGRVVEIGFLSELVKEFDQPFRAVIMAGGFGTRLKPLTDDTPKPMLPLDGKPLLEHTIGQLRNAGITRIHVTTHYKSDVIQEYFGNGKDFGVDINYVREDEPLGTAGGLGYIDSESPLLVLNGDILTHLDYRAILAFHREQEADITVGVRKYDVQVPYGIVETDDTRVIQIREKPQITFFVNVGIYLIEPSVLKLISPGKRVDMPDLIRRMISENRSVVSFPLLEYWIDIGRLEDYQQAQKDIQNERKNKE